MKAIFYHQYGQPDVLQCEEIATPAPNDNEVLIKVRAASVNPLDWHMMRGTPYIGRIAFGLRKPKLTRPGVDVSGQVEAVGKNVTEFKPSDAVFGSCRGAFAEYVCASESALVTKPNSLTFEQAACVPVAGYTALQGLRDKGQLQPGQKVLIDGASGGVGTFAVQVAKSYGAHVTAVCSTINVAMVRSIGADRVIDYTREDFTQSSQRYDLFFDLVANHPLSARRRVLSPKGVYIGAGVLGVKGDSVIGPLAGVVHTLMLSWFGSQRMVVLLAKRNKSDLIFMRNLMQSGKVTPVIDRCYSMSEVSDAIRHLAQGYARGKIVITIA
jgi:NADPH:quinone reductase-like Zn-dependent oxidoreductase